MPRIMLIGADAYFSARSRFLAELSQHYAVPAIYQTDEFTTAGGLMSYGGSVPIPITWPGFMWVEFSRVRNRQTCPVQQSTKVQLIVNLKTAKSLGITLPLPLLGRADEVIE